MIGFVLADYFSRLGKFLLICNLCLLIGTIFCSILIFLNIRKMMKMVDSNSIYNTYNDLRRAAFVCIFQACLISLDLLVTAYLILYSDIIHYLIVPSSRLFFSDLGTILAKWRYSLFQIFVIIDTSVTLSVLRSYRNVLKKIFSWLYDLISRKRFKKKKNVVFVKSVNNVNK